MGSFLYRIYQYVAKKRLLSGIGLLALFAILIYFAFKIEFEEDITKLIPSNSKTEEVQKVLKSVNFSDKIIVNIVRESGAPIEELTSYATDFLDSISKRSASHIKKFRVK